MSERDTIGNVREVSSNGAMDESSGKVQKASAHPISLVMVDVATVQLHVATTYVQASTLPNKEGKCHGKVIQRGDG